MEKQTIPLTGSLEQKTEDITRHKNLREPLDPDERVLLCLHQPYQPSEDHVNAGGEARGGNQEEKCLHNIWPHGFFVEVAKDAANVAD